MVFPRHLSLEEMSQIAAKEPDIEYDIFVLIGKCPNIEGLCTFLHTSKTKRWPCEIKYEITAEGLQDAFTSKFIENQHRWSEIDRRNSCGLCILKHLDGLKVKGLKLVGRGASLKMKVENVRLLKYALSLRQASLTNQEFNLKMKAAYKGRFGTDCTPQNCYYPEFFGG